jgi:hypothetical protein
VGWILLTALAAFVLGWILAKLDERHGPRSRSGRA